MAPITKHKREYILVVVAVVLVVVVCLVVFREKYVRCYLRPMSEQSGMEGGIMDRYSFVVNDDGSLSSVPIPTPTPHVVWKGLQKTAYETYEDGVHFYRETFSLSGKSWAVFGGFLLAVAGSLTAISIALYYVIRSSQQKKREEVAKNCKKLIFVFFVGVECCVLLWIFLTKESYVEADSNFQHRLYVHAPIIYLYDDECREATVKLDLAGELTCTYPTYNDGWTVKTSPDGTLTDANGRKYEYLFWEANLNMNPDTSRGFCVKNSDTAAFLEKALASLGLSDTEANTFIMYWMPVMEENPYNLIYFQTDVYENAAKLEVTPTPDTIVRVNMFFQASDEYVEIEEQDLSSMNPSLDEREGFVVVEWGGEYMSSDDA